MTYKSIYSSDPWPDECPKIWELSADDLLIFLEDADVAPLSEWEWSFCKSIERQLRKGWRLSPKQMAIFDKGLLKTLWENDPALWDDLVEPERY